MILKDLTTGTTPPINNPRLQELWIGITGTGGGFIEQQGDDGVWRTYPEYDFTATVAKLFMLKAGAFRFVISSGPITIEIAGESI